MDSWCLHLFLILVVSFSRESHSMGWFSWANSKADDNSRTPVSSPSRVAKFSIEPVNDPKGMELVERAERILVGPNSCWQNVYRNLFADCAEILKDQEKQQRLAWYLSDCFQKDSGRAFPSCSSGTPMIRCLENLDKSAHHIYLAFFLETNTICHQLQSKEFKLETERLVDTLIGSAQFVEDKLRNIEETSELLLRSSNHIHSSLASIDDQTQQVAKMSKEVGNRIVDLQMNSNAILEQSKGIVASQLELQEGQAEMKVKMEAGMALLHESYESLGDGIEKLKEDAIEIEKEIYNVGEAMSSKMQSLQSTADDIENVAGRSLERQKELLNGQSVALEGINILTKTQSQALEESKAIMQELLDFGHKNQEDIRRKQEELEKTNVRLTRNLDKILAAQEDFESKQASMFIVLDKLFAMANAIMLESRFIKAFFYYLAVILYVYLLTSAKQISRVRAHFYLSICFMFAIEFAILRFCSGDLYHQTWIESNIFFARSTFVLLITLILIPYSIITHKDYDLQNYQLLFTMKERMDNLEKKTSIIGMNLFQASETDLSSWIDTDEDDICSDPDYALPEEVAENSTSTTSITRKYHLRHRVGR